MNRGSTLLLQGVLLLLGVLVVAFCGLALPPVIVSELGGDFDYAPLLFSFYVTAVPFLFALYQASRILRFIEKQTAFSSEAVSAFKKIKFSALTISAMYALGMPYIFYLAQMDDAPGLVALGLVIIGASFVIATAAAVFQSLLQNAVELQSENELTV